MRTRCGEGRGRTGEGNELIAWLKRVAGSEMTEELGLVHTASQNLIFSPSRLDLDGVFEV